MASPRPGDPRKGFGGDPDAERRALAKDRLLIGARSVDYDGKSYPALGPQDRCWVLLRKLDAGGMGVVYYGVNPRTRSPVAIKALPPEQEERQPALAERFVQEARIAAQVRSANLVCVFEVDKDKATDTWFFVMEYIHGLTAGKWRKSFPGLGTPEADALEICIAATQGLRAVHSARVDAAPAGAVHRDVKPDNIFIPFGSDERPELSSAKLGDLGLACPQDSGHEMTGDVAGMGTPGYASPEQLHYAKRAHKASDVFSMGATLYALLTGSAPFSQKEKMKRIEATRAGDYRPLDEVRTDLSSSTAALVRRCLKVEPTERYADADALHEAMLDCRRRLERARSRGGAGRVSDTSTVEVGSLVKPVKPGRIVVVGGPPRAVVTLSRVSDGGAASEATLDGEGCATLMASADQYRIVVAAPAYEEFTSLVSISAGADAEIRVQRRVRPGLLDVESDPAGAEVLVDDRPAGATPLRGWALPAGVHKLTLRRAECVDVTLDVMVEVGATTRVGPVTLQSLPILDAPHLPEGATLEIDGRPVADGDRVAPGAFVLVARRRGFETQRLELTFAPGTRVRPELLPWRREAAPLLDDVTDWDAAVSAERESAARAVERRLRGFVNCGLSWFEAGGQRHEIALFRHEETGVEFALVPGAKASVGSPPDEEGRRPDEKARTTQIAPFLCARTPVALNAWRRVMGRAADYATSDEAPVGGLAWGEAAEFCARAGFEMPTEWEREYAARAGTTTRFSFGDDAAQLDRHGWSIANSGGRPREAGRRAPNAFGLFDVHGNVADWCAGVYVEDGEADGASGAEYRPYRGGTCRDRPEALRSAARGAFAGTIRGLPIGVRPIVRVPAEARRVGSQIAPAVTVAPSRPASAEAPTVAIEAGVVRAAAAAAAPRTPAAAAPPAPTPDGPTAVPDLARWRAAASPERRRIAEAVARALPGFALSRLERFESGDASIEAAVFRHAATEMEFCLVPGGATTIGSRDAERGRLPGEARRELTLPPFLLARTPTTQAAWACVMDSNPSSFHGSDLPVECVTWDEAVAFCAKTGLALPGEAQWEHACRAGTSTRYSFGDDERDLDRHAWYEFNSDRTSHAVGAKRGNALGLFDVHGNVWEWCEDAWDPQESGRPATGARGRRVVRGGGWAAAAEHLRCAARLAFSPTKRSATVGFRPALMLKETL